MWKISRLVAVAVIMVSYGGGRLPVAAQGPEAYRVGVDVDLVVLHATISGRRGRLVTDLVQKDFEVYENGVRQSIAVFEYNDTPVAVGLVVDHSRSMLPKLSHVIAAAEAFVDGSNRLDQMFVVNFSDGVSLGLPWAVAFTNRAADIKKAVANSPAPGMTSLYDGIVKGIDQLEASSRDKKVLLVVSDGGDNASTHKLADVLEMADRSATIIYTIGLYDELDPDRDRGVLERLARETGGKAFFPNELSATSAICESIAREIRNQYTIGYVPSKAAREGSYRAIRMNAQATEHGGKLLVRTRTGYVARGRKSQTVDKKGMP